MLSMDVSIPIAFMAGIFSFLTPCMLPMVPVYIMYITGATVEEEIEDNKKEALIRTIGFILGFSIIFIIMGTSASYIGKIFIKNKEVFTRISGVIIVLFGLIMMDIIELNFSKIGFKHIKIDENNWFSSILIGMTFAAGWTPCFGPILGGILMYASKSTTVTKGLGLLLVYSLGMGIPFILTALFINKFNKILNKRKKLLKFMPKLAGIIMIIFGILVFFDKVIVISRLLI